MDGVSNRRSAFSGIAGLLWPGSEVQPSNNRMKKERPKMYLKRILGTFLCALILCGCAVQEKRVETIRSQHPEWDANTVSKLGARNIENGMTRAMVQAALGTASSVSKAGEEEVWAYVIWLSDKYAGPKADEEVAYSVRFRGDKVVGTSGDASRLP